VCGKPGFSVRGCFPLPRQALISMAWPSPQDSSPYHYWHPHHDHYYHRQSSRHSYPRSHHLRGAGPLVPRAPRAGTGRGTGFNTPGGFVTPGGLQGHGNGVGRNGVGRFRRTSCTGVSVHVHGYVGAHAPPGKRHCIFLHRFCQHRFRSPEASTRPAPCRRSPAASTAECPGAPSPA